MSLSLFQFSTETLRKLYGNSTELQPFVCFCVETPYTCQRIFSLRRLYGNSKELQPFACFCVEKPYTSQWIFSLRRLYGNSTELQDFKHRMSLQAYLCVMGVNLITHVYIYIYIYVTYTSTSIESLYMIILLYKYVW